jgi:putative toxin-antitoxin system antitoxin component (TIGR02293 family)
MNAVLQHVPEVENVFTRMGRLLDLKIHSEVDALRIVTQGISSRTYQRVAARLGLPADLVAPESTVRRRLLQNSRFSEAESERVVRLARVFAEASELFGDEQAALNWFRAPAEYLHDQAPITPMALAATDAGARLVESHIRRTAYGFL